MRRRWRATNDLLPALVALLALGAASVAVQDQPPPPPGDDEPEVEIEEVEIEGRTFRLEVAADDESRAKGLSNRDEIDDDGGMLFIYPEAEMRRFWMAYCLVDIDIMFLDAEGRILAKHEMKKERPRGRYESERSYFWRLKRYSSRRPAQFAIELKAETLDELDLEVGDEIELDLDRLKKMAK